ncbi:MAG: electron transfer flavoprotein subunit beta/FixA family protein [bacterium]|nr:electron transfer flavoprotein subunit beta/FixA family protein [bacterium]
MLKIIVCIKQVPDTSEIKINPQTNTLIRDGVPSIINPFDKNALEEAIKIKEKIPSEISVITMGPPQAQEALKESLAMGADNAYLLSDRNFAGADTWATSYTLAKAIEKIGHFDLIILGKQAIDGDTAQVGPELAEQLNIPQITYVKKLDLVMEEPAKIIAERLLEDCTETVECRLPVLITVTKEINEPRHPSLKGVLKAKKAVIPAWNKESIFCDDDKIGLNGSFTQVMKIFTPPVRTERETLSGTPEEMSKILVQKLKERKII